VVSLAFSSNGLLASGSRDNTVRLWNTSTGELLKTLTGHTDAVVSVAFNWNGLLASGSWDKKVLLWNSDSVTTDMITTTTAATIAVPIGRLEK